MLLETLENIIETPSPVHSELLHLVWVKRILGYNECMLAAT